MKCLMNFIFKVKENFLYLTRVRAFVWDYHDLKLSLDNKFSSSFFFWSFYPLRVGGIKRFRSCQNFPFIMSQGGGRILLFFKIQSYFFFTSVIELCDSAFFFSFSKQMHHFQFMLDKQNKIKKRERKKERERQKTGKQTDSERESKRKIYIQRERVRGVRSQKGSKERERNTLNPILFF